MIIFFQRFIIFIINISSPYHFVLQQVAIKPHLPIYQNVESIFLPSISYILFIFWEVYNSFLEKEIKASICWHFLNRVSLHLLSHCTDIVYLG